MIQEADAIKVKDMFVRAAQSRVPKMQKLAKKIDIYEGMGRHNFLFVFYCHCRVLYSESTSRSMAWEMNAAFKDSLEDWDLEDIIHQVELHYTRRTMDGTYTFGLPKFLSMLPVSEEQARELGFLDSRDARFGYQLHQEEASDRDKDIIRLWSEGLSAAKIAKQLKGQYKNVSTSTVKRCLRRMNLKGERVQVDVEQIFEKGRKRFQRSEKNGVMFAQNMDTKENAATIRSDTLKRQQIWEDLINGKDCCILGAAGTGKTVLLKKFCEHLTLKKKKYKVIAPTGCAASNVGGMTIHRGLLIPVKDSYESITYGSDQLWNLCEAEVLIIDEIGMVAQDLFIAIQGLIDIIKTKKNYHIQLVVTGDFRQLAPVSSTYAFNLEDDFWKNAYLLNRNYRQDDQEFFFALNQMADGDTSAIAYINQQAKIGITKNELIEQLEDGSIYLGSFKDDIQRVNNLMIDTHKKDASYKVFFESEDQELHLPVYEGMPIIFTKNAKRYVNGTRGTIVKVYKNHVLVSSNDQKMKIYPKNKEFPFTTAYAMTIHKSQGLTLDKIILNPKSFAFGQIYTALSRVRSVKSIILTRALRKYDIKVSPKVKDFMKYLSENEQSMEK